jgi:predicted DCC family thiol-disulfide oxidoreductase YuxK
MISRFLQLLLLVVAMAASVTKRTSGSWCCVGFQGIVPAAPPKKSTATANLSPPSSLSRKQQAFFSSSTSMTSTAKATSTEHQFGDGATAAAADPTASTTTTVLERLQHPVILFDGVCNFCNVWVDLLLSIDANKRFRFAPLQSEIGRTLLAAIGRRPDDISSVVLIYPLVHHMDEPSYHVKSACVLKVVEELGPVAAAASASAKFLLPAGVRDSIYDTVAENRYSLLGKRDQCRSGDPQYYDRFLS